MLLPDAQQIVEFLGKWQPFLKFLSLEDSRKLAKLMLISWDKPGKNCDQMSYIYFIVKLYWQNLSTDFSSLPCLIYNTRKWRGSLLSLWAHPLSSCDCAVSYLTVVLVAYLCQISKVFLTYHYTAQKEKWFQFTHWQTHWMGLTSSKYQMQEGINWGMPHIKDPSMETTCPQRLNYRKEQ